MAAAKKGVHVVDNRPVGWVIAGIFDKGWAGGLAEVRVLLEFLERKARYTETNKGKEKHAA
ncbi:hypothetical protein IMZ48_12660 [Candidatus Bathyarchaeota archaeon]|nr:hypothetical protein [Candidatus Bathyarchaeota archaeon]